MIKFVTTAVSEQMPEWVRIMTTELKGYMQKEAGYYLTYMDAILEQGLYIYMYIKCIV